MVGSAETTISPSISSTSRNTPWVHGCWGPMLTVIVSVRISGMPALSSSPCSTSAQIAWICVRALPARVRSSAAARSGAGPARADRPPSRPVIADRHEAAPPAPPRARRARSATRRSSRSRGDVAGRPSASTCRANTARSRSRCRPPSGRSCRSSAPGPASAAPVPLESPGELRREVLRVRRAAAVAEHEHLAARAEAADSASAAAQPGAGRSPPRQGGAASGKMASTTAAGRLVMSLIAPVALRARRGRGDVGPEFLLGELQRRVVTGGFIDCTG